MPLSSVLLLLGTFGCIYMAWSIGANDAANAMGTSVGAKSITLRQAIIISGIFEFAGAFLVGSHVTTTVRKGIVDVSAFTDKPVELALGMFAALLAAAIWLNIATNLKLPVSTTHSIVGAVVGFGLIGAGIHEIHWTKLGVIASSWIVSPLVGGLAGFANFMVLRQVILRARDPVIATKRYGPLFIFPVFVVLTLATIYKGFENLNLSFTVGRAIVLALAVGGFASLTGYLLLKRTTASPGNGFGFTEKAFGYLQVITACYMAFAHGANDVANAVGPMAAISIVARTGAVDASVPVPTWLLVLGGIGIVLGVATMGYKVIQTIGRRITDLTPTRGFCAEMAAATTVLVASKLGLPISTTHTVVGAVIGVGFARGISALNLRVIKNILLSWALEIPITAALSVLLFLVMSFLFL
ncbi:MAG: inorganic phosphate transporter [Candidatus Eisenbacteria bacterium]